MQQVESGPLIGELRYQNVICGANNWEHQNVPSVEAELLLLQEYTNLARTEWVRNEGNDQALDVVRKLAAISLRCLANHGCPEREMPANQ